MELIATGKNPVAYAYGATLDEEGGTLDCGLLMVKEGTRQRVVTFIVQGSKKRIRAKLPTPPQGHTGHLPYINEVLEVVP